MARISSWTAPRIGLTWSRWIVVEPGVRFESIAERAAQRHAGITVLNAFVEDAVEQVRRFTDRGADIVLCSSVLHEVDDERAVLEAVRQVLSASHAGILMSGAIQRDGQVLRCAVRRRQICRLRNWSCRRQVLRPEALFRMTSQN